VHRAAAICKLRRRIRMRRYSPISWTYEVLAEVRRQQHPMGPADLGSSTLPADLRTGIQTAGTPRPTSLRHRSSTTASAVLVRQVYGQ
jgi:hypothetical protein